MGGSHAHCGQWCLRTDRHGLVPAGERGRTVFRYADSNVSAAVCATMDGYKTFCMGFPIETIDDPKAADRLVKDVLAWFGKE